MRTSLPLWHAAVLYAKGPAKATRAKQAKEFQNLDHEVRARLSQLSKTFISAYDGCKTARHRQTEIHEALQWQGFTNLSLTDVAWFVYRWDRYRKES